MHARALAYLAVLLTIATPSYAGIRAQCNAQCGVRINAFECVGLGRKAFRRCKKGVLKRCRTQGLEACSVPTTTTTSPAATTTTFAFATTTTAYVTTTTLPAVPNYSGHWNVSAVLTSNPCGANVSYLQTVSLDLLQVGTSLSGTAGALTVTGALTAPNAFVVSSAPLCNDACCATDSVGLYGIVPVPGGWAGTACVETYATCTDGSSCLVTWGVCP